MKPPNQFVESEFGKCPECRFPILTRIVGAEVIRLEEDGEKLHVCPEPATPEEKNDADV